VETKLIKIAEIARQKPKEKFTSLYHYINKEMLLKCHKQLLGNKATGIDDVTKQEYSKELNNNIENLVTKLRNHSYKPQAVCLNWARTDLRGGRFARAFSTRLPQVTLT
jgi:hypothetical protein